MSLPPPWSWMLHCTKPVLIPRFWVFMLLQITWISIEPFVFKNLQLGRILFAVKHKNIGPDLCHVRPCSTVRRLVLMCLEIAASYVIGDGNLWKLLVEFWIALSGDSCSLHVIQQDDYQRQVCRVIGQLQNLEHNLHPDMIFMIEDIK